MTMSFCRMVICLFFLMGSTGCGENAESWNDKAFEAFSAGRQEDAIRFFNKAVDLDPDNLMAHFYLGWIYEMQGRADEGIAEFKKALAINPNHGGVYNRLAGIYLAKGMLDEAIEAYQKVIALNPYSETAYYGLGIAYHRKDKFAEAGHALFEAGLLAIFRNNKRGALNAYKSLKETGNVQLADELQKVLGPWFDPATEAVTEHK